MRWSPRGVKVRGSLHTPTPHGLVHGRTKIIYYSKKMQDFKKTKIQEVIPSECRDCDALPFCGGGCRAQVKNTKGSFFGKDEMACKNITFLFNEILPLLEHYSLKVTFAE